MPRDCTAQAFGLPLMNSPVHVAGSNTNMTKKRNLKKVKQKKKGSSAYITQLRPGLQGPFVPAAYGSIKGSRPDMPMMVQRGRNLQLMNYEEVASFANTAAGGSGLRGFGADGPSFNGQIIRFNPGVSTALPWASGIAKNFQKFRFKYLRFFYTSAVPTSTAGSAYIYLDYDYQDATPGNLGDVGVSDDSSSGNVWFGGAINRAKAFEPEMNADCNIYVDVDVRAMARTWYWVRTTDAALTPGAGVVLSGTATGGNGTLAVSGGTFADDSAIPFEVIWGCSGVTGANPGYLYAAYVLELDGPILSSKNT